MVDTIHDQMSKPVVLLDPNAPVDPNAQAQKEAAAAPVVEEPKIEKPPEEAKPEKAIESPEAAETAESGETGKAGAMRGGGSGAKARPGRDAGHSEFQPPNRHENFSKLPEQFGHRINTNVRVAEQARGSEGGPTLGRSQQGNRPDNLPPGLRHGLSFDPSQSLSREAARALLKDPVFRGPFKDSPLHQKLRAQAMGDQALRQGQMAREAGSESLKRGDVAQLFRMRHQIQEKDQLKTLMHGEIAKLKEQTKQKVQAIRYQTESHGQGEEKVAARLAQMGGTNADAAKQELAKRLRLMSGESDFEQALQRFLAGEKAVPDLPEGVRARFATKSDAEWEVFFQNTSNLNSAEVAGKGNLSKMVDALFRGLFHKSSVGKSVMVSDLTLAEEGTITTSKFAQIPISDKSLAALFKQLMPGDVINRDMLQKLGQEFDLIRLVHLAEAAVVLSEAQRQQVLREFRQQRSLEGQRNFERALIQSREEREEQEKSDSPFPAPAPDLEKLEERLGSQKFFMYMLYGIITIAVVMILFLVIRLL